MEIKLSVISYLLLRDIIHSPYCPAPLYSISINSERYVGCGRAKKQLRFIKDLLHYK